MEKFSYEEGGYNREEVKAFIDEVITKTEDVIKRCKSQKNEIERLKDELQRYRDMENGLKDAIIKAEEAGDNIKKMAREESRVIISDAKNNASRIVNDALLRAEKVEVRRETLERNMRIFKKKLKLIIEQQMAVVDEIEILDIE